MANAENRTRANELLGEIEAAQRLIPIYREADEVIVGTKDRIYPRRGLINQITLPAAEIRDRIVAALERRVADMQAELRQLGVD
jgi:hypothetical protein